MEENKYIFHPLKKIMILHIPSSSLYSSCQTQEHTYLFPVCVYKVLQIVI